MLSALFCSLALLPGAALAGTANLELGTRDFILTGGAGFVSGHGAPTGMALRSGNPGQHAAASFPQTVLAPGSKVTDISFSYRYISGYGAAGVGHGANLSLSLSEEPLRIGGNVIYRSPHYTDYSYSANQSNYSAPVHVHISGLSIPASDEWKTRLQIGFWNNDRNLQLLVPIYVNVTCYGLADDGCFVSVPTKAPTPAPGPMPPAPIPPATHTPWKSIGPWNIGDDINNGGEAGTIAPAVSPISNPQLMYMGGVNNAASSGVLKSVDQGKHWSKMNEGLFDTRPNGLFIVDDKGDHVLCGTLSGVFETLDGAKTWTHVPQTRGWGVANSFRNGTINGKSYIFVGANGGLGNVPLVPNAPLVNLTWNLIRSPPGSSAWRTNVVSVADFRNGKPLDNSVVAGCVWNGGHGVVHIATVINETAADWNVQLDQPCQAMALDPNDADHMIVNNASNGAHIYESADGGKTYHTCLNQRGAVMVAIDRRGWFYGASEGGAFVNRGGVNGTRGDCVNGKWEQYFVRRIWRRTNRIVDRGAHDYQRINIDFAGGVSFGSDQGMFVQNWTNRSELQLYSANGDVNNNIIMHPAIAEGEAPGERCIVTALWDWGPVASWDSGKHWPSWQTPDDGAGMGYFGEGGGCFGVGKSKNVLCMHHHNVAYSSRCGKNMSRLVVPHGASVTPPYFARKPGSRSEPAGPVVALMTMGRPPWDTITDKALTCEGDANAGDLGVHPTPDRCLSHVDMGLEYGWYPRVNAAVWRGDTDKHCYLCRLSGNSSSWNMTDTDGAIVFALEQGEKGMVTDDEHVEDDGEDGNDEGGNVEGEVSMGGMRHFNRHVEKSRTLEMNEGGEMPKPKSGLDIEDIEGTGNPKYVLKSWNFGANWTWVMLPDFLQGVGGFSVDPTNDTLYGVASNCIARSYDHAQTWEYCWDSPGLEGSFKSLVIKDSQTMLVMRNGDVPLRTRDGGKSWERLSSVQNIARCNPGAAYSWSGKTLALSCISGRTLVWVSKDDGDTWVDESGDYSALSGGIAQWYENTLYISSMGQGISAKVFNE